MFFAGPTLAASNKPSAFQMEAQPQKREQGAQILLGQCEQRWDGYPDRTGAAFATILDFAQYLTNEGQSSVEDRERILDTLIERSQEISAIEKEAMVRSEIMRDVKEREKRLSDKEEEVLLEEYYNGLVGRRKKEWGVGRCGKNNDTVKQLEGLKRRMMGLDEDEELMMQTQSRNIDKCPITRADMVDPLKNMECVHTYSTVGIVQLIAQKNGIKLKEPITLDQLPMNVKARCPVAPCSHWVSRKTLKKDYQAEYSQRQQRAASQMVDRDEEGLDVEMDDADIIIT